jgi:AcrR family transcriptional regulator
MPPGRRTAAERRDALVRAAHRHFARGGLHGTAVSAITDEVGITQPYAFSLFGTKQALFLAACDHNTDRIAARFRAAATGATPEERLHAMGEAYVELLEDRDVLLMQLQSQAACGDPDVRAHVHANYSRVRETVRELSGADDATLMRFLATGMFLNLVAAIDAPGWVPEELRDGGA